MPMPSGGYPIHMEDRETLEQFFAECRRDPMVKACMLDWLATYVGARMAGATAHEAAFAAYVEWDL